MKAFVTGAGSYIGYALIDLLRIRGVEIRGLARNPARLHNLTDLGVDAVLGDMRNKDSIAGFFDGIDVVYHLAGTMIGSKDELDRTNVEGSINVLEAAAAAGVKKLVFASSASVYGEHGEELVDEECDCKPILPYGQSKLKAEEEVLARGDRLDSVVCRLGGVYGPRSQMLMLQTGGKTHVRLVGKGDNWMSVIHVADTASALTAAAERGAPGAIYNISDSNPVRLGEFYDYLAARLGGPSAKHISEANAKRIAKLVGFFGRITGKAVVFNADFVKMVLSSLKLSNEKMRTELGVEPCFPDYRSGLDAILDELGIGTAV